MMWFDSHTVCESLFTNPRFNWRPITAFEREIARVAPGCKLCNLHFQRLQSPPRALGYPTVTFSKPLVNHAFVVDSGSTSRAIHACMLLRESKSLQPTSTDLHVSSGITSAKDNNWFSMGKIQWPLGRSSIKHAFEFSRSRWANTTGCVYRSLGSSCRVVNNGGGLEAERK